MLIANRKSAKNLKNRCFILILIYIYIDSEEANLIRPEEAQLCNLNSLLFSN